LTYLLADVVRFTDNRIVKCTLFQMQKMSSISRRGKMADTSEDGSYWAEEYAT